MITMSLHVVHIRCLEDHIWYTIFIYSCWHFRITNAITFLIYPITTVRNMTKCYCYSIKCTHNYFFWFIYSPFLLIQQSYLNWGLKNSSTKVQFYDIKQKTRTKCTWIAKNSTLLYRNCSQHFTFLLETASYIAFY